MNLILNPNEFSTSLEVACKPGDKYAFITRAGPSVKMALHHICNTIWNSEQLPRSWSQSTLLPLQGSGACNELKNYRFIHMKTECSKFFGNLVMKAAKDEMMKNMSKYQIGARPGHRAQEHLFSLKCVISFYNYYNQAVILSTWDVQKFLIVRTWSIA